MTTAAGAGHHRRGAVGGDHDIAHPVPGNTEDLALKLAPQLTLNGTRTTIPEAGYNYELLGSMDTSYMLALHHIGMDDSPQIKDFTGLLDTVLSGFIPDFTPPG